MGEKKGKKRFIGNVMSIFQLLMPSPPNGCVSAGEMGSSRAHKRSEEIFGDR